MHAHHAHNMALYDYHMQASVQALTSKESSSWRLIVLWHESAQPASHTSVVWTLLLQALVRGRFAIQCPRHGAVRESRIAARHVQSPRPLMCMSHMGWPFAGLAIDGNELYSASEDGSVIAWDLRSCTVTRR